MGDVVRSQLISRCAQMIINEKEKYLNNWWQRFSGFLFD